MTVGEKLEAFKLRIAPDAADERLLYDLLEQARTIVLNRRFPFGYSDGTEVPSQYERIQLSIAVELYSKMGAEGETSHSENGISRSYEAGDVSPSLLKQIIPMCGSVMINANP